MARRRNASRSRAPADLDEHAITKLVLFATNDGDLYRQMVQPIIGALAKKIVAGKYDPDKAIKAWLNLADEAAKKYDVQYGSGGHYPRPKGGDRYGYYGTRHKVGSLAWIGKPERLAAAAKIGNHYNDKVTEEAAELTAKRAAKGRKRNPAQKQGLCPVCGSRVSLAGKTTDGRVYASCGDAFYLTPGGRWARKPSAAKGRKRNPGSHRRDCATNIDHASRCTCERQRDWELELARRRAAAKQPAERKRNPAGDPPKGPYTKMTLVREAAWRHAVERFGRDEAETSWFFSRRNTRFFGGSKYGGPYFGRYIVAVTRHSKPIYKVGDDGDLRHVGDLTDAPLRGLTPKAAIRALYAAGKG